MSTSAGSCAAARLEAWEAQQEERQAALMQDFVAFDPPSAGEVPKRCGTTTLPHIGLSH